MTHRIVEVNILENFVIAVAFQNGKMKTYDVRQLTKELPQFETLQKNIELFHRVQVDVGGYGVVWNDELDLSADEIWENGTLINKKYNVDIKDYVGYQLANARKRYGITQKELADKTGIFQADISNIERGLANPSVKTLERLAEGMGVKLKIDFE